MRNLNVGYDAEVDLATLIDFPENPNQGDDGLVAAAIEDIGFYGAIVADQPTRTILAGHTRKRALLATGETTGPVLWVAVDDLDHARRVLLVDNRANRVGYDDPTMLRTLLEDLARTADGLAGTGYDGDDLDVLIQEQAAAVSNLGMGGLGHQSPDDDRPRCPTCGQFVTAPLPEG